MLDMWEQKFRCLFSEDSKPKKVTIPKRTGAISDFENVEADKLFSSKSWTEIDREKLAKDGQFFHGYLTEEAFSYYLPALILASLENKCSDLGASMEFIFCEQQDILRKVISNFTAEQKKLLQKAMEQIMKDRYGELLETDEKFSADMRSIVEFLI